MAHKAMFLFFIAFKTWYKLLMGETDDMVNFVKKRYLLILDVWPTQKETQFKFRTKVLHFVRASSLYHFAFPVHSLRHISVAVCVIQLLKIEF